MLLFQSEVLAKMFIFCAPASPPLAATTRAQSNRAARNLAMPMKKSAPMANPKVIFFAVSLMLTPRASHLRRYSTPVAMANASSCTALPPAL